MMATIADSTEFPPAHFPVSSSVEVTNGTFSVAVENCQLCGGRRRSFYCRNCVRNGEIKKAKICESRTNVQQNHFSPNNGSSPEHISTTSYKEKWIKWQLLLSQRKELEERCQLFSQHKILMEEKRAELMVAQQRNEMLKEGIEQARLLLRQEKGNLTKQREENKARIAKTQKKDEKRKRIQVYIKKGIDHIESVSSALELSSHRLKVVRHQHAQDLVICIFPISEILPKSSAETSEEDTVDLLAEARHTSYVKGRWVYVGHESELGYGIVHPTLPGNGDYSAYHLWSQANKDEGSTGPEVRYQQRNPANNIGAALQYTAQMVTVLSYLLDVNLPYRVWYSDFGEDLPEDRFQSLVFKLNSNILHLCCTQNVAVEELNPSHSLQNLSSLIRATEIGRIGTFQVSNALMQSFEETCPSGLTESGYSDHDDELDGADVEWEQVSGSLPEADIPSFYSSTQVSNRNLESVSASQSLTGGLMSSATAAVTSLWRGWGTKPASTRYPDYHQ